MGRRARRVLGFLLAWFGLTIRRVRRSAGRGRGEHGDLAERRRYVLGLPDQQPEQIGHRAEVEAADLAVLDSVQPEGDQLGSGDH